MSLLFYKGRFCPTSSVKSVNMGKRLIYLRYPYFIRVKTKPFYHFGYFLRFEKEKEKEKEMLDTFSEINEYLKKIESLEKNFL